MSRETRTVQVCDECGSHDDISDCPQIGGDYCDDCAHDQLVNHRCTVCQDFDINTGPLLVRDGKNICDLCLEESEADL